MDEKLLKEGIGIEEIAEKINKIAKKELPIEDLKDNTNSMEKWTSIPCLLVLSDEDKDRFMSYVEYLDSSDLSIKEKALIITSLAGLMEHKKLKLSDYDNGSLYLISIFYKDKSFEEIDKTINVLGRQEILYAIRKKSLDMEERKKNGN